MNVIGVFMVAMWLWLIVVLWVLCCGVYRWPQGDREMGYLHLALMQYI